MSRLTGQARRLPYFIFLLALLSAGNLFAADVTADFTAANHLYAEGKFSDAAAAYEKILATGTTSANLLFNYGNAAFKVGHPGQAIAAYRRALQLAPRDAAVRASLAYVRSQTPGSASPGRWQNWLGALTLNESAALAAICFWALFALLAARQLRPALVPKLRGVTRVVLALTLFFGALLAWSAVNHFRVATVVVTAAEATARTGPFDEAQSVFTAHDGAELRVLDRHDAWLQVADAAGKTGWLNQKQVTVLPGV